MLQFLFNFYYFIVSLKTDLTLKLCAFISQSPEIIVLYIMHILDFINHFL